MFKILANTIKSAFTESPEAKAEKDFESLHMSLYGGGSVDLVREKVKGGFDLNCTNKEGYTLLEYEVRFSQLTNLNRLHQIKELISLGANPNHSGTVNHGCLYLAIDNIDTDIIRVLLDAGVEYNSVNLEVNYSKKYGFSIQAESILDFAIYQCWFDVRESKTSAKIEFPENNLFWECPTTDLRIQLLDELSTKYHKKRPEMLFLLREQGALSLSEIFENNSINYLKYDDLSLQVYDLDFNLVQELLNNGFDFNALETEGILGNTNTVYDLVSKTYYEKVWCDGLFNRFPKDIWPENYLNTDIWLEFLDELAIKYKKPRPDILRLLRKHGALSLPELLKKNAIPFTVHASIY